VPDNSSWNGFAKSDLRARESFFETADRSRENWTLGIDDHCKGELGFTINSP